MDLARISPYWRDYWALGVSLLLSTAIVIGLFIWIVAAFVNTTGFWPTIEHAVGPVIAMVGALVAAIATNRYSSRIRELRSTLVPVPLEDIEDTSFEPWRAINHSFSVRRWTPDIPHRVREHLWSLCTHERIHAPLLRLKRLIAANVLERLNEETSTENYRLVGMKSAVYLRIHKSPDERYLECADAVGRYLLTKKIFETEFAETQLARAFNRRSDAESQYIVRDGRAYFPAGTLRDEPVVVQVFPYANTEHHFRGNTLDEIISVAMKLGQLQTALASSDDDLRARIVDAQKHRHTGGIEADSEALTARLDSVRESLKGTQKDHILDLDEDTFALVEGAVQKAIRFRVRCPPNMILLHDVHPHNTLFARVDGRRQRECVLIHDFGWVGLWNHNVVTAFAIHRFVREYVRQQVWVGDNTSKDAAKEMVHAVRTFIEAYKRTCKLPLADDFLDEIESYIICGNVEKLVGSLEKVTGSPDLLKRDPRRVRGEFFKFVRFIDESKVLGRAARRLP